MNKTLNIATNTFTEGLVMDFCPDNTKNNTLSQALNATLITFNGNEMALQNDMGNGRVETAFLPEGYVPVGTCEFGDIIYIVSYNPLINKSLIGCFPSPERNISTEELGGINLSLDWKDFQEGDMNPSGELKTTSIKKILFDDYMRSGDKYIIYAKDLNKHNSNLSDYGNTAHEHNKFPKLLKIHVVSIEDSGKIVFLDSSVKWYDNNYYLLNTTYTPNKVLDLDSYRTMVNSAYSVFQSKVSGKLALLIELEKIKGFSCTWEAFSTPITNSNYSKDIEDVNYSIYWNFNWETNNPNINPSSIVLTKSEWTGENKKYAGKYQKWEKGVDNNYYLGGDQGNNWIDMSIELPKPFNNINYYNDKVDRYYIPETYRGSYEDFINNDSYLIKSEKDLDTLAINGFPTKINRANELKTDTSGKLYLIPKIGEYYINCSSVIKDGNTYKYYTINDKQEPVQIQPLKINDDLVNNTFKYPITSKFADFNIPIKLVINTKEGFSKKNDLNINNLIYHYEMTPAMPYGLLREYSQDGYIDFKKLGTKSIKLNTWKYYNFENTCTLTWGMEAYTEPNKGISEVVFEFCDNLGVAACYKTTGKSSYNGKFTEYLLLNSTGNSYKLSDKNSKNQVIYHKGLTINEADAINSKMYLTENNKPIFKDKMEKGKDYYENDAGTLYSNCLYLVKIIIKYCDKDILGNFIESESNIINDYRWFWTNTLFNDYYYSVLDFKELLFNLTLDSESVFLTTNWNLKNVNYKPKESFDKPVDISNSFESLSANVLYINLNTIKEDNVKMAVRAGLQNTYNTFNLEKAALNNIKVRIFLGKEKIENNPLQPNVKFTQDEVSVFQGLYPTNLDKLTGNVSTNISKTLAELMELSNPANYKGKEMFADKDSYSEYKNDFKLLSKLKSAKSGNTSDNKLVYINNEGELQLNVDEYEEYDTTLNTVWFDELLKQIINFYPLQFSGVYFSKYYYLTKKNLLVLNILRSFILKTEDLSTYNLRTYLTLGKPLIRFKDVLLFSCINWDGRYPHSSGALVSFDNDIDPDAGPIKREGYTPLEIIGLDRDGDYDINIKDFFKKNTNVLTTKFNLFFPIGFGYIKPKDQGIDHNIEGKMIPVKYNEKLISNNVNIKDTVNFIGKDLGGTLAGISNSDDIEPGYHYDPLFDSNKTILTRYIPQMLAFLTLLYYVSDETEGSSNWIPSNYIYLDNNKISYERDLIVELKTESKNESLVFRGFKYQDYLDKVILNSGITIDLKNEKNVLVNFVSCLKNTPVKFEFNYIKPESEIINVNSNTLIKSIYTDLPKETKQSFNRGLIYGYDSNTKTFKNVRNLQSLKHVFNYTVLEGADNNLQASYEDVNKASLVNGIIKIDNIKDLLTVKNDKLELVGFPSYSGTYTLLTNSSKGGGLENFKNNLKFYEEKI